jgi:N-acetylmuramoyl-L-alanine amidase
MIATFTIDRTTWRSPNHDRRHSVPISAIVVHSCEGRAPNPRSTSLPWLCNPASKVSAHYYVCRSGAIYQLVDDADEAWHAGKCVSAFGNAQSLGIECEHRTKQDWPAIQKQALAWLLRKLAAMHHIPPQSIETHGQIALPGPYNRKVDPSDWPHTDFDAFVGSMFTDAPPSGHAYVCLGLPIYEQSTRTGKLYGFLLPGAAVEIDDEHGHLADSRGFVDINGLVPKPK